MKRPGFSLLEIIVVLAIIAVLSAGGFFYVHNIALQQEDDFVLSMLDMTASASAHIAREYRAVGISLPGVVKTTLPKSPGGTADIAAGLSVLIPGTGKTVLSLLEPYLSNGTAGLRYRGSPLYVYYDETMETVVIYAFDGTGIAEKNGVRMCAYLF